MTNNQFEKDEMEVMMILKKIELYCYKLIFEEMVIGLAELCEAIGERKQ